MVENIFDKDIYYREFYPENTPSESMDFAQSAYFNEKGQVVVTYLTDDNYKPAEFVITIS